LVLSHASGLLSGLVTGFSAAQVAPQAAGITQCLARQAQILEQVSETYRVRALDRSGVETGEQPLQGKLATHVLYRHKALPLARPVSIRLNESGIHMVGALDEQAALTVVLRNRQLETVHSTDGLDVVVPAQCLPGESIVVNGHQIRLIEVKDG